VQGSATQATFSQLTAQEIAATQLALQLWSDVANVTFTQVNPGGYTDNATILFSNYNDPNDGAGAFAFYPGSTASSDPASDVYLNITSVSTSSLPSGSYSAFAIMHEIGHTLGLSHPGDYNAAPGQTITYANNAQFIEDSQQYSVMSYFDDGNTGGNAGSYPDTPLLLDVYAAQQIYGPNMTTRTGDTVYGFGSNAGAVYDFAINSDPVLCIWDAGGTDTLNCSGFSQSQLINLTAGVLSSIGGLTGNVSIALGATIENAIGGSGADTLIANDFGCTLNGGGGSDTLTGGDGSDTLIGGSGDDILSGGLGINH
jgi:Peptidase M10 serralysin C terminal/Matrixin